MTDSPSLNALIAFVLVVLLVVAVVLLVDRVKQYRGGEGLSILDDRPPCEPGWTAAVLTPEQRAELLARYKLRQGEDS